MTPWNIMCCLKLAGITRAGFGHKLEVLFDSDGLDELEHNDIACGQQVNSVFCLVACFASAGLEHVPQPDCHISSC
jgi:hypothetical protein